MQSEIFISYSWKEESKLIADQLEDILKEKKMRIVRDVPQVGYKGLIKDFMKRIGKGKYVILIVGEPFLKSEKCIYELIQIYKSGKFNERIFPIVMESAKIYNVTDRTAYTQFWEEEVKLLEEKTKGGNHAVLHGVYQELNLYGEIKQHVVRLTEILKNINTLSVRAHQQEKFADLVKAIEKQAIADAEGEVIEAVPAAPELDATLDNSPEATRLRELEAKIETHYNLLGQQEEKKEQNKDVREEMNIRQEIYKIRHRIRDYKEEINMMKG